MKKKRKIKRESKSDLKTTETLKPIISAGTIRSWT